MNIPRIRGDGALASGRKSGRFFRRKRALGVLVAGALLAIGLAVPAIAVTGSPSGFESSDGNMVLNATTKGTNTDWNCFVGSDGFQSGTPNSNCAVTTGGVQITADQTGEVQWVSGRSSTPSVRRSR